MGSLDDQIRRGRQQCLDIIDAQSRRKFTRLRRVARQHADDAPGRRILPQRRMQLGTDGAEANQSDLPDRIHCRAIQPSAVGTSGSTSNSRSCSGSAKPCTII